jgi:hypothetical protein
MVSNVVTCADYWTARKVMGVTYRNSFRPSANTKASIYPRSARRWTAVIQIWGKYIYPRSRPRLGQVRERIDKRVFCGTFGQVLTRITGQMAGLNG